MPQKICSISSMIWEMRCSEPTLGTRPGSVTSTESAAMRASRAACSSSWRRRSRSASTRARTSLASLPTCGRSSGESLPIWRSSPVSEPFLPVTVTRIWSSPPRSVAPLMPLAASASMALRSSMIAIPVAPFVREPLARLVRADTTARPSVPERTAPAQRKTAPAAPERTQGRMSPRYHLVWPPAVCPAGPLLVPCRGTDGSPTWRACRR